MTNILREPAQPFALFTYADFLILIVFNCAFFFLFNRKILKINSISKFSIALLFLFIIPLISAKIEVSNVYRKFTIVDGFNLLYIYLKIPIWWLVGLINILLINLYIKKTGQTPKV